MEYGAKDFQDEKFKVVKASFVRPQGFICHDSDTLARAIIKIIKKG